MKQAYLFLFSVFAFGATAQPVIWQLGDDKISVGKHVQIFEDTSNQLTAQEIVLPKWREKFVPSQQEILSFGITNTNRWLKLELENNTDEKLFLEVAQFLLPMCNLHFQEKNGQWQEEKLGYTYNLKDRKIGDHFQVFELPQNVKTFYLNVYSYNPAIPINIWSEPAYAAKSSRLNIVYGVYIGILIFVIVYNIYLFLSLGNRIYLFYSLLVLLFLSLTALVMDGFGMYFFNNIDYYKINLFLPSATMAVSSIYAILFLEIKRFVPHRLKLALAGCGYFIVYWLVSFALPAHMVLLINQINALLNLFFVAFLGHLVTKHGNKVGFYYAMAYYIYFAIVILEVVHIYFGKPPYLLGLSYVALAIFIEVNFLSYALTKRFQWEREANMQEKLDAQNMVIIKTQENERIVKAQNTTLEDQVARRTKELEQTNVLLSTTLRTVEEEKAKSDALLLNILPEATAEELKQNGFAEPRDFENVSILFTDFKDFTATTAHVTPARLVEDLNVCFKAFDAIVHQAGLEKIKTIGDSYMAVSGLPKANRKHAIQAVNCGLAMLDFIEKWQIEQQHLGREGWQIRIGIHSGPVVAGVVGAHKFAYDIWGDAVNTASRMETNSDEGRINISADTFELVKDYFKCTSRGKHFVKGKGEMEMFWVERALQANA